MRTAQSRFGVVLLAVLAVAAGATIGVGVDRVVLARQEGVRRTILTRTDAPAGPGYEAVMGVAEIAPGARIGKHRHNGVELAYVLEGTVVGEREGQPAVTFKAGDSIVNLVPHDAVNPGKTPARLLAVYIVEKGKPLAEPVK